MKLMSHKSEDRPTLDEVRNHQWFTQQ
jgi:hypothetical protein